jgi:hypothetical protein
LSTAKPILSIGRMGFALLNLSYCLLSRRPVRA